MKLISHFISESTVVILLIIMTISCNNQKKGTENARENANEMPSSAEQPVFDKLVGTWQSEYGKTFECWIKNAGNTYMENNQWVFENTVKGQNDGKVVKFVSTILNDTTVQFSNPAHDFPTDVNYTVADANTVDAFIIGSNNKGGNDTIPFNYTRLKQ